jgi:uncharacterized membrane protein
MINDLITFGAWYYFWKIFFYAVLFLIAIVVAYPVLLLIALWIWWAYRSAENEAALETEASHEPMPRATFGRPATIPPEPHE